jgi:hypothetical protein
MKQKIWSYLAFVMLVLILACGPKVMVPPEIDLTQYSTVGLINFTSDAEGNLGEFVTQKFLEEISSSQKEARIVELGGLDEILEVVQRDKIDREAVQAIGQKHNVNSIITGNLKVSDVKPKVGIASLQSMSVKAEVEAEITVRLLETGQGATVWTASARGKETVAQVSIFSGDNLFFDAEDPEEAYGDLARSLVDEVTSELKISHKRL